MANQWYEVDENDLDSYSRRGNFPHYIEQALNGTDYWWPNATEVHWFILDLGQSYTITKVRGKSSFTDYDPIDIDVYVSDDKGNFGAPVVTGISTWKNTQIWEEIEVTPKTGRYIKFVVNATEQGSPGDMAWGAPSEDHKIVGFYGSLGNPYPLDRLKKNVISGYHCFMDQYMRASKAGLDPLKLPDGTIF